MLVLQERLLEPFDLRLTVRVGCCLRYEVPAAVPAFFKLKPRSLPEQVVSQESLRFGARVPCEESEDTFGNLLHRIVLPQGPVEVVHDALITVAQTNDAHGRNGDQPLSATDLPVPLLRYTLPSRYCDSDKLIPFAWQTFGMVPAGHGQVQAVCDWVHRNIDYRFGSGRPDIAASEVVAQRFGVCRDFAHVGIALCRALNIPARYVTGHLPDIGYIDPGSPMDFHAYFEVYLGGRWFAYDPRYNVPRIGRIAIARGLDAVDGAFATIYGPAILSYFEVWAYQVAPGAVSVGDPIDLTKRLDGTETVRRI